MTFTLSPSVFFPVSQCFCPIHSKDVKKKKITGVGARENILSMTAHDLTAQESRLQEQVATRGCFNPQLTTSSILSDAVIAQMGSLVP